jgi:DNA repair exonuclease SbcCD nuclease subunit
MRLLHFADLHLDRSFAGVGMATSEAGKRREELRAALRRIVDLALEKGVDAVTVGGDLYEHERITADTANFIADQFARLAPRPVLIAPGNHDPYLPESAYRRASWPDNVHIFRSPQWEGVRLGGVTVWGAAHTGPAVRDNLLAGLRADSAEPAIALVHASDLSCVPEGKAAHAPFRPDDVEQCGARLVLLGHYHELKLRPAEAPLYAYPGSPEPLGFGEEGPHYVLLIDAGPQAVRVEPVQVNEVWHETRRVDVTGMTNSDQVRQAIAALAGPDPPSRSVMRVVLTGLADPELDIDGAALISSCAQYFRYLDPIVDRTEAPLELDQLREEPTARGAFVRLLEERLRGASPEEAAVLEDALHYGLQAFAGREVRRR